MVALSVTACAAFSAVGIIPDDDDPAPAPRDPQDGGDASATVSDGATSDAAVPDASLPSDGGCVLDTPTDCGQCGHSCKGAACKAGQCTPDVVVGSSALPITSLSATGGAVAWVQNKVAFGCDVGATVPCATPVPLTGLLTPISRVYLTTKTTAYGSADTVNTLYRCIATNCASANGTFTANGGAVCSVSGADITCIEQSANNTFRIADGTNTRTLLAQNGDGIAVAARNNRVHVALAGAKGLASFVYTGSTVDLGGTPVVDNADVRLVAALGGDGACWVTATGSLRCGAPGVGFKTLATSGVTAIASDGTALYYVTAKQIRRIKGDGSGELLLVDVGSATVDAIAPSYDGWVDYATSEGVTHLVRRVAK